MEYIVNPCIKFEVLCRSSVLDFEPFRYRNSFADTTFSLMYSWHSHFDYRYCPLDESMIITGVGINGVRAYIILRKYPDTSVKKPFLLLCESCRGRGERPVLEYVPESEIYMYKIAAETSGIKISVSCDERYSDYIYKIDDFVSVSGSKNKTKRGGINYLARCCPDLKCMEYSGDMYSDCMHIFDKWCVGRSCAECHFGCEKKAFADFMEIYDPLRHKISVAYSHEKPLSFIVCEQINDDTVSCYYQKNSIRQRGLTYWLNREILQCFNKAKYLDLGEDMGLSGLAEDKSSLRPCGKHRKYTIKVI